MELTAKERVVRARIQMQRRAYFIYSILFYSKFRMDENIPTAATDIKGNMLFSPRFVDDLSEKELMGIIFHETAHQVLMHPAQSRNLNCFIFNIAADIVVNIMAKEEGMELPSGALTCDWGGTFNQQVGDTQIIVEDCHKKDTMTIYYEIMEQLPDHDGGSADGDGEASSTGDHDWDEIYAGFPDDDGNEVEGKKGLSGAEVEKLREKMKDRIREAYNSAKMRGNMPQGFERALGDILESKLPWRSILQMATTSVMPHEESYRLPHKRSYSTGVYMPHIEKESVEVIWSFDTSGSMDQEDLTDSLSEAVGAARQCHNLCMTAVICDSVIHRTYTIKNGNVKKIMAISMEGGGGTSHIPVYEWVEKNHPNCKLLINITDGYTEFPEDSRIPTLWVLTKNSCSPDRIPFGRVIQMYR